MRKTACFKLTYFLLKEFLLTVFLLTVFLLTISCSTKPKNTGEVFTLRTLTEKDLETGNNLASRGNSETARELLSEVKRKAITVDDTGLIIRSCLSLGNVLLSLGRNDEALSQFRQAVTLAEKNPDRELLAASRIYNARGRLLSDSSSAKSVLDEVTREAVNIKTNKLYLAFSWQVRGHALRVLGSYSEAESAFKQSLDIHQKQKYLENASYDWYTIAFIRSTAGKLSGALQALEEAIALDRRVENSWGLAANWRAMGDVYRKSAKVQEAADAYRRARNIYSALGFQREADEVEERLKELQ